VPGSTRRATSRAIAARRSPWPIARQELQDFARGLELIIVVEEKRSLIEVQVREELSGTANQPVCIGKKDESGNWLFPVKAALDSNDVAICLGERLLKYATDENLHCTFSLTNDMSACSGKACRRIWSERDVGPPARAPTGRSKARSTLRQSFGR